MRLADQLASKLRISARAGIWLMSYVPSERIGFRFLSDEQISHYASLARTVLKDHDLQVTGIDLIAAHSNVKFRVSTADGTGYTLRIGSDPMDAVNLPSELAFMKAVGQGTDIPVPSVIPDREGRCVTTLLEPEGDAYHECVLFTWLEGRPVGAAVSVSNYALIGETAAKLHVFSKTWKPPADFRPLKWSDLFYYPGVPVLIFDGKEVSPLLPMWSHDSIHYLAACAMGELAALNALPGKRALHGNIEMWNVLVNDGRPGILDFEEVMYGQPVHDIAISLHYGRGRADYTDLCDAFRAGYERVSSWPVSTERQLDVL